MRLEWFPLLIFASFLAAGGCGVLAYLTFSRESSPLDALLRGYVARLERHTSFLMTSFRGRDVARAQLIACLAAFGLLAVTRHPTFALIGSILAVAPPFLLWKRHVARVAQLERQLDAWLLMLANALKATSSVGEAIASTATLVPRPFSEEVDLLVKEIRLGTPLDRAIQALAQRINSSVVSGALVTIIVARQTGGDLSRTLERASAALREAARLEGVLRAKTAEGRGQVLVLASIPFLLCVMIAWLDKTWFDPMLNHHIGRAILAACAITWTVAAFWAHQIAGAEL